VADLGQGRRPAQVREALAQAAQALDHARVARVDAEEDQAPVLLVDDALVVDERRAHAQDVPEHGHVPGLALDGVGEVDVGAAGVQLGDGDLLDRQHHRGARQVLVHRRAGGRVVGVREDPDGRRLHHELQAVVAHQVGDVGGHQRDPAFPLVLVFPADADGGCHDPPAAQGRAVNEPADALRIPPRRAVGRRAGGSA